ncbi:MAG: GIY-YIG nuclease family protein [Candidatus Azambacteria bacterium]|nr:GIY-YIG nuclease family protein [Candidatus Azambacteria bacterium]
MKSYVYILKDERGKFYVGSTSDMRRRIRQHLTGHTQTTRNMKEPKLVLSQEYESIEVARRIERKIKKLKRKDYIAKMMIDGYIKMK